MLTFTKSTSENCTIRFYKIENKTNKKGNGLIESVKDVLVALTPLITALRRERQEDICEFEAYIVRLSQKQINLHSADADWQISHSGLEEEGQDAPEGRWGPRSLASDCREISRAAPGRILWASQRKLGRFQSQIQGCSGHPVFKSGPKQTSQV